MRIISDQKDYYDCIQSHGQDLTNVYFRKREEVKVGDVPPPFPGCYLYYRWTSTIIVFIIGFCGKLYPGVSLALDNDKYVFCYSVKEVDQFVEANYKKRDQAIYFGRKKSALWREFSQSQVGTHFNVNSDKYKHLFEFKKHPIFVITSSRRNTVMVYNPLLRDYEFYRVKDPYTAFQEIAMYMSNMARPEKKMPVISDELKVQSHGFDKFSFRKSPAAG